MCLFCFGDVSYLRLPLSVDVLSLVGLCLIYIKTFCIFSSVTICQISIIRTSIFYPDISISICGQALSASKVMDIFSLALSVFNVKHEIKMIQ